MQHRSFLKNLGGTKKYFLILLLSVSTASLFFWAKDLFRVKRVTVNLTQKTSLKLNGLSELKNESLIFLSEKKTAERLETINPEAKSITVRKRYPDEIVIYLTVAEAQAELKVSNGYFILDKDGRILAKTKTRRGKLALINYYQLLDYFSFSAGDKITHSEILAALKLIGKSQDLGLEPNTIDIRGSYMIALNLKDYEVSFSGDKDLEVQIYQYETIVKQLKVRGQSFKRLDLRFDKPVIEL